MPRGDRGGRRVTGKTLLHLQCHFGMDTLNWARLGDGVTGLDFSAPARGGSEGACRAHRHRRCDVCAVQRVRRARGDCRALRRRIHGGGRAVLASGCPRLGGGRGIVREARRLDIYDCHPVLGALDNERVDAALVLSSPYFETAEPNQWDGATTYVDGGAEEHADVRVEPWAGRDCDGDHPCGAAGRIRARASRCAVAGAALDDGEPTMLPGTLYARRRVCVFRRSRPSLRR